MLKPLPTLRSTLSRFFLKITSLKATACFQHTAVLCLFVGTLTANVLGQGLSFCRHRACSVPSCSVDTARCGTAGSNGDWYKRNANGKIHVCEGEREER